MVMAGPSYGRYGRYSRGYRRQNYGIRTYPQNNYEPRQATVEVEEASAEEFGTSNGDQAATKPKIKNRSNLFYRAYGYSRNV